MPNAHIDLCEIRVLGPDDEDEDEDEHFAKRTILHMCDTFTLRIVPRIHVEDMSTKSKHNQLFRIDKICSTKTIEW